MKTASGMVGFWPLYIKARITGPRVRSPLGVIYVIGDLKFMHSDRTLSSRFSSGTDFPLFKRWRKLYYKARGI